MKTYRRTCLYTLVPVVDFSFTSEGIVYTLKERTASRRRDRVTFTLQKKGERKVIKRHFTFKQLCTTFVFLRDNPRTCPQPKSTICLTYTMI